MPNGKKSPSPFDDRFRFADEEGPETEKGKMGKRADGEPSRRRRDKPSEDTKAAPLACAREAGSSWTGERSPSHPWKVLVVDDEADVHAATRLVLTEFAFEGRPIELLSGHSGADAKRLMAAHPDVAVLLLDVVMENDQAGLEAARHIRETLGNRFVRIILRTGLPGQDPEIEALTHFDINDYHNKASLSSLKLWSALTSALRDFRDLMAMEETRRKLGRTTDALTRSQESLNQAQAIANVGSWDWDLASGELAWSDQLFRILGLPPRGLPASWRLLTDAMASTDDNPAVNWRPESPEEDPAKPGTLRSVVFRIRRPDGAIRDLKEEGKLFRDASGAIVRIIGLIHDITERRAAEARTLRTFQSRIAISALLETGLEALPMRKQLEVALDIILTIPWLAILNKGAVFLYDPAQGHLELIAHRNLTPAQAETCRHINLGHCLCGEAALKSEIIFASGLDGAHRNRYAGIKPHGHYCVPIKSPERLIGVLNIYLAPGHVHDAEEDAFMATVAHTLAGLIARREMEERLHIAEDQLRELAHHDQLTGLPNRLLFRELLRQNLAAAQRLGHALAVMFIDLDGFKQVNDDHGHEAGDHLLIEAARRIRGGLRDADTVARIGGDEFTVILPDVEDSATVGAAAKRILDAINRPFPIDGVQCQVGASIGISLFPDHGQSPDDLLKQADQAMYAVKRAGKADFRFVEKGEAGVEAPSTDLSRTVP